MDCGPQAPLRLAAGAFFFWETPCLFPKCLFQAVCKLFKEVMTLRAVPYHGFNDWKNGLPWIFITGDDLLYSTALQSTVF